MECPTLRYFPGKLQANEAFLWMLQAEYPECQRLQGGGFCPTCMRDVVRVRVVKEEGAPPVVPVVRTITIPRAAESGPSTEVPRWRPK